MSHDVRRIGLEVYDSAWLVQEAQALRLWSLMFRLVLTFLGVVRPSTPKMADYEP